EIKFDMMLFQFADFKRELHRYTSCNAGSRANSMPSLNLNASAAFRENLRSKGGPGFNGHRQWPGKLSQNNSVAIHAVVSEAAGVVPPAGSSAADTRCR